MIDQTRIFKVTTAEQFTALALDVFRFQSVHCEVYSRFIRFLAIAPASVHRLEDIPFLPVEFFKSHAVTSSVATPQAIFSSSGTTGAHQSKHRVADLAIYEQSYRLGFNQFYGAITDYVILALLPSYQERQGSSLIYMVDDLISKSGNAASGYLLNDHAALNNRLMALKKTGTLTLLIGVTYALLDFADRCAIHFPELLVMETGGMKGKRKEMIREDLHTRLTAAFGVKTIHSEYGMTELLSQAYSKGNGLFYCPPWMKVLTRDPNDPLTVSSGAATGGINIIDLANINSCSFLATQDLGSVFPDGGFEIMGRFDHSDIRGCNLLIG